MSLGVIGDQWGTISGLVGLSGVQCGMYIHQLKIMSKIFTF